METRERILEAAVRLFAETGSRGATTRRIAHEAGINEVTLFRHFGSKESLLQEALHFAAKRHASLGLLGEPHDPERELTEWARKQLKNLHGARSLIRTAMGEFEEHPELSAVAREAPIRVANELHAYVERLQKTGKADAACDARAASALLMGAIFSDAISRDLMPERYPYSLEAAAGKYIRLFLRAIEVRDPDDSDPGAASAGKDSFHPSGEG